ncbi:methyltransferase domain-containing protein [Thalassospiraceae bacterium LMO-JJ14]|nr:methyltransferase domain-containing protein [Thalassospiraceae bacterium LMO-JJ14]
MRDYARLDAFLDERLKDIYPEPFGEPHIAIITQMIPKIIDKHAIPKGAKVLDVGCGHGLALNTFREHGMDVTGVGFGEEAEKARAEGFEIIEQDMSFLDVADASYDLAWCRHVIEHSVFPFFTLAEMFRILKPGGVFYMEVPAPDTVCQHEANPNHYSVLTRTNWTHLLHRTGFENIENGDITFNVPAGPDTYYSFDAKKP